MRLPQAITINKTTRENKVSIPNPAALLSRSSPIKKANPKREKNSMKPNITRTINPYKSIETDIPPFSKPSSFKRRNRFSI